MNYGNVLAIVERSLELFEAGRLSRREVAGLTVGAIGAALGSRAARAVDSPVAAAARPPLFQATELNHAALRVDWSTGRALLLLLDGHSEYISGELQIHRAGFTRWLNGFEQSDERSHTKQNRETSKKQKHQADDANASTPGQKQTKRKRDVEADALLKNKIEAVLAKARNEWPNRKKFPGVKPAAKPGA